MLKHLNRYSADWIDIWTDFWALFSSKMYAPILSIFCQSKLLCYLSRPPLGKIPYWYLSLPLNRYRSLLCSPDILVVGVVHTDSTCVFPCGWRRLRRRRSWRHSLWRCRTCSSTSRLWARQQWLSWLRSSTASRSTPCSCRLLRSRRSCGTARDTPPCSPTPSHTSSPLRTSRGRRRVQACEGSVRQDRHPWGLGWLVRQVQHTAPDRWLPHRPQAGLQRSDAMLHSLLVVYLTLSTSFCRSFVLPVESVAEGQACADVSHFAVWRYMFAEAGTGHHSPCDILVWRGEVWQGAEGNHRIAVGHAW